jgi:polysaccharide pyruvyl transferase WcaK-like protein
MGSAMTTSGLSLLNSRAFLSWASLPGSFTRARTEFSMKIHHFYPRTNNIGDHVVQRGIEQMVRTIVPEARFELFDINSRGENKVEYGLTQFAIDRANREADLVIVGGSNLYEGSLGWPWGVHLEVDAIAKLRAPLFLLGIGSGSNFASPLHRPTARAREEIKLLNEHAALSGARDVVSFNWLQRLGVTKAKLMGDPATFLFNYPLRISGEGHVLITMPPRRFWSSKRQLWKVATRGRRMFRALVALARNLTIAGEKVVVACNDPLDLPTVEPLFEDWRSGAVVCPQTTDDFFKLLSASRAVVSGRLHTAVAAFSLGIPFVLLNEDARTDGFLKTYELERWSIDASSSGLDEQLAKKADDLTNDENKASWESFVAKRNQMHSRSMNLLRQALRSN